MTAIFSQDGFEFTPEMKKALVVSLGLHIGIFIFAIVGLPYISKPPRIPETIAVEIVDISEMTTTNKKPNPSPIKPVEEKPTPKVEKKVEAPPKVEAKEPPKIKPLDKPIEKKEDTVKPEPKVPPLPSEKLEKPKPEKKEKPKEEEAIQQEDDFLSVLKNLQDSETPSEEVSDATKPAPQEQSPLAKFSEKLSATEVDAIQAALNEQFRSCWNLMAGARNAEDIVVRIELVVSPSRRVQSAKIVEQMRYNTDSFYRAAADEAMRAVRHPNCEVLDLPADKYDLWKNLTFNFNPSAQL